MELLIKGEGMVAPGAGGDQGGSAVDLQKLICGETDVYGERPFDKLRPGDARGVARGRAKSVNHVMTLHQSRDARRGWRGKACWG